MSDSHQNKDQLAELNLAVSRLHAGVLALVFGLLGGVSLFVMTAWLLIKGGDNVGAHLQLLNQYLYGYSVSWPGSLVGLAYGLAIGGIIGWAIGMLYNRIAYLRRS